MLYLKKHPLFSVFLIGMLLRLFLMFLDFSFDVHNHIAWAKDLWGVGFANFYLTPSTEVYASLYPNYPPFAMYIFYAMYPLHSLIYDVLWWLNLTVPIFPSKLIFIIQERYFVAATMKIPSILADLGIAWLSYVFAKKLVPSNKHTKNLIFLVPVLILFNPAYFYNSAYWGQIDAIPIFFVLAATYLLLYSPRYLLSGLLFTTALLVKPTPIVFLPIFVAAFIKKFGLLSALKSFVLNNIYFILSFLPLIGSFDVVAPYSIYLHSILQAQSLAFVTNSAFNIWAFTRFDGLMDSSIFLFNMTYRTWGYAFLSIAMFIIMKLFYVKNNLLNAMFLSAFAFFLFATKMHERYTLLLLPFLLLASVANKKYLKWYVALSILSYLNLYFSWPVPRSDYFIALLHSPVVYLTLSICHIGIFFYLLYKEERM